MTSGSGRAQRLGFAGLGRMGSALVPHLLQAGAEVTVWNRHPEKIGAALAEATSRAADPRELASCSDVVMSMLYDDEAVKEVYLGGAGLLSGDCAGRLFIEMSTIRPDTVRMLAEKAGKRGAALIDAPVSGSVEPARAGKLLVLAGGPREAVERARPLLSLFARRVEHVGAVGAGAAMKIVIQLPIAIYWQSLAESLAIGGRSGLDPAKMLELLADSPAALPALAAKLPVILGESRTVAFTLDAARKDLAVMADTAALLAAPCAVTQAALAAYRLAVAEGQGEEDIASIAASDFRASLQR